MADYFGTAQRARDLIAATSDAERQLNRVKADLAALQRSCRHEWGHTIYAPIVREGYQFPGDPEGTMGVDRQLPMWVPRQETPQWTRECKNCCLVETTQRVNETVTKTPRF